MLARLFLIALLFSSCAQIGVLDGGAYDRTAPKPITQKMNPPNGTINFNGNALSIPFDEFIVLNNPQANLVVVPPNIKPTVSKKGKTVFVKWNNSLLPNTTYSFYFNGLVQDLTEKNDSIMQFVFSTGSYIDSLSARFIVLDAQTGTPQKNITLGLYDKYADTLLPRYFGSTNAQGISELSFLKEGQFEVLAFQDLNKDLKIQPDEKRAFLTSLYSPSYGDSVMNQLSLYSPVTPFGIRSVSHLPPYGFHLALNGFDANATLKVNEEEIKPDELLPITKDSLHFLYTGVDTNIFQFVYSNADQSDTARVRVKMPEFQVPASYILLPEKEIISTSSWVFLSTANMPPVNESNIQLLSLPDSSSIGFELTQSASGWIIHPHSNNFENQQLSIFPDENLIKDTLVFTRRAVPEEALGEIRVNCPRKHIENVLQLISNGSVIREAVIDNKGKVSFKDVAPGEYSFQIIEDVNGDGDWTTGSLQERRQPEKIIRFPKINKLRPSWELEVDLVPSDNE